MLKFYYSIPIVSISPDFSGHFHGYIIRVLPYRDADYTWLKHIMWYRPYENPSPPYQRRSSPAAIQYNLQVHPKGEVSENIVCILLMNKNFHTCKSSMKISNLLG